MDEEQVLSYVKAAAQTVGILLDEPRAKAVALHFGRTLAIARQLENAGLVPQQELAEIYRPAPFPAEDLA